MAYTRPSSEALLIAALINSQDVDAANDYGVTPEMFVGYQPEFRWIQSYFHTYKAQPSWDALKQKFPDFPATEHFDVGFAADEVRRSHTKRTLVKAIKASAAYVAEGDIDDAIMAISNFTPLAPIVPLRNSMLDLSFFDDYDTKIDALGVPWGTLNSVTGGMREGDLWYTAARLGQGKSWSLGCFARDAMMAGRTVHFYSLEMPERQVQTRMHVLLGAELGFSVHHIDMRDRNLDQRRYRKIMEAIAEQVPGQIYIQDLTKGRVSPSNIAARSKDADLVIIDYVGLMASPMGQRSIEDWRVAASISNMLKEVAVASETRILAASQINREGAGQGWRPPRASQLAQSDSLGQDADVVLTQKQYGKKAMVYSVEKNRHGASGSLFFTHFNPNVGHFEEITRDEADDIRAKDESE